MPLERGGVDPAPLSVGVVFEPAAGTAQEDVVTVSPRNFTLTAGATITVAFANNAFATGASTNVLAGQLVFYVAQRSVTIPSVGVYVPGRVCVCVCARRARWCAPSRGRLPSLPPFPTPSPTPTHTQRLWPCGPSCGSFVPPETCSHPVACLPPPTQPWTGTLLTTTSPVWTSPLPLTRVQRGARWSLESPPAPHCGVQ